MKLAQLHYEPGLGNPTSTLDGTFTRDDSMEITGTERRKSRARRKWAPTWQELRAAGAAEGVFVPRQLKPAKVVANDSRQSHPHRGRKILVGHLRLKIRGL